MSASIKGQALKFAFGLKLRNGWLGTWVISLRVAGRLRQLQPHLAEVAFLLELGRL